MARPREITDDQIGKAVASIAEGKSQKAACKEQGFSDSTLIRRCDSDPELAGLVEEAKEMGKGALELLAYNDAVHGWWVEEEKSPGVFVKKQKRDPRLVIRMLEQRYPDWKPDGKVEVAGTLTHEVERKLTELESKTVWESLHEALPGGLASLQGSPLGDQLGLPAGDGHPGAGDVEQVHPALPAPPADRGSAAAAGAP